MKKGYIVSRVNVLLTEHSEIQKSLDEFYNSPKHYLKKDYLTGNINSNSPKFAFALFASGNQSPKKEQITYSLQKNHHPSQQRNRKTFLTSTRDDGQLKQVMTDKELHEMFNSIHLKQNKNKIIESNYQLADNPSLNYQSNALRLRKSNLRRNERLIKELASKSNKRRNELLINSSNDYRVKQEARLYLNKYEMKKNSWIDILRQPNISPYQKVDTKRFFVNKGTSLHPKWDITSLDAVQENVINPDIKEETVDEAALGLDFFNKNSNDHSDLMKVINKSKQLKEISVEGKSCLKVEYDNFKSMKGNKFIRLQWPREQNDDVVLYQSKPSNSLNNSSLMMTGRFVLGNNSLTTSS